MDRSADDHSSFDMPATMTLPFTNAMSVIVCVRGFCLAEGFASGASVRLTVSCLMLSSASNRFASIQNLISAISTAADQKGILDLQARISAELGMLQNEQLKVQILNQSTQAQQASLRQQAREQVIDGHGRFDARFQPIP